MKQEDKKKLLLKIYLIAGLIIVVLFIFLGKKSMELVTDPSKKSSENNQIAKICEDKMKASVLKNKDASDFFEKCFVEGMKKNNSK